jgi:hypothetical protein
LAQQSKHAGELKEMVEEMMKVLEEEHKVRFKPGVTDR